MQNSNMDINLKEFGCSPALCCFGFKYQPVIVSYDDLLYPPYLLHGPYFKGKTQVLRVNTTKSGSFTFMISGNHSGEVMNSN